VNKKQSQAGSVHLIVTFVLVLALIGALGFVFYQNFVSKTDKNQDQESSETTNDEDTKTATKYKTFSDGTYGISFQYPENWTLGNVIAQSDMPYWNRSMDVNNENGETMATLVLGVSGLGGTCAGMDENDIPSYAVLDSEVSSIKAKSEVAMHFTVNHEENYDKYNAYYGLSDTYTSKGDYEHVCLFYDFFNSGLNSGEKNLDSLVSFGNGVTTYGGGKKFSSLEDVNKYLASDEYTEIKKMLLSLSF